MLTIVGSLIVQVAPETDWPTLPTSRTDRVFPTSMLAVPGVIEIAVGGIGLYVMAMALLFATLPAASVACTWMVLEPLARATLQVYEPEDKLAAVPLHATLLTPERVSDTDPLILTGELKTVIPLAGAEILTAGGVRSRFTVVV